MGTLNLFFNIKIIKGNKLIADFMELVPKLERGEKFKATISRVAFVGKWVEFWFEENYPTVTNSDFAWNQSTKNWKLWDVVEEAELLNDVYNHGLIGKVTTWEKLGPNYELKSIE